MRILIAEDEKFAQESLKFFLSRIPGIEIVGLAENGKIAIKKLKNYNQI